MLTKITLASISLFSLRKYLGTLTSAQMLLGGSNNTAAGTQAGNWTVTGYFGDDVPSNCVATCQPFISDINYCSNLPNADDPVVDAGCACTASLKSDLLPCGNCIIAGGNTSARSYELVEFIQLAYPDECNSTVTFTGIDPGSYSTISSAFSEFTRSEGVTFTRSSSSGSASRTSTGTLLITPFPITSTRSASGSNPASASASASAKSDADRKSIASNAATWVLGVGIAVLLFA
ncbi:hypothetical protein T439DRAFT_359938 [Meredithblackwellia eburnea MCA 4105]